jgi:ankyrin repeat protein
VRLLLDRGADVEAKEGGGQTALMVAAESGHEAVVRLLKSAGASQQDMLQRLYPT